VQVGDLVRRNDIGKDRLGVVLKYNGDSSLLFVYWGSRSGWILPRRLEVVNENR